MNDHKLIKSNIDKQEVLLDQIQQIIGRGLFFAQYSKKYRELYIQKGFSTTKKKSFDSPNRTMIVVQNVLYAQESMLCLKTLFSADTREACFNALLKRKKKTEVYNNYKEIEEEYYSTVLNTFRNKLVAHKDSKNVGDPFLGFLNPIEDQWLDDIIYFYDELSIYLHNHFECIENDIFDFYYKDSFDYLYKRLEKDEE